MYNWSIIIAWIHDIANVGLYIYILSYMDYGYDHWEIVVPYGYMTLVLHI